MKGSISKFVQNKIITSEVCSDCSSRDWLGMSVDKNPTCPMGVEVELDANAEETKGRFSLDLNFEKS